MLTIHGPRQALLHSYPIHSPASLHVFLHRFEVLGANDVVLGAQLFYCLEFCTAP